MLSFPGTVLWISWHGFMNFLARFYEFPGTVLWISWHGFMKIVAGTTSIFLLGFPYFRNTDNYRNKEVCVEIQYCFIQTLLAIDLSTLKLSIWVLPGFFQCFSIRIISNDFFFCFSKLLNGFKSRNHIVSCPSKACTKNVIPLKESNKNENLVLTNK